MASIVLIYPFDDATWRHVNQGFGNVSNTLEPPYPDNAQTELWKATNGQQGVRPAILNYHRGVDFAVPSNQIIRAAADGTVEFAGWDPYGGASGGYGNMVTIKHSNGWATLYGHNASLSVSTGATVTQGQQISVSDSTGNSTGPHLHFGVNLLGSGFNDAGWTNPIYLLGDASISAPVPFTGSSATTGPNISLPGYITVAQAVAYARQAGFPESEVATAAAVADAESSLRIGAIGPTTSAGTPYGLWQIESAHGYDTTKLLSDPLYNAQAAFAVWSAQGWQSGWETYSNGMYKAYLPAAKTAAETTPIGSFPQGPNASGITAPPIPIDSSPELPVDVVDLHPVTLDRSKMTRRRGLLPTAGITIAGVLLPVTTAQYVEPQYRTAGSWQATLPVSVFDRVPHGTDALDALFARNKTQVDVHMGYVAPGRSGRPDPRDAAPVFTGLAYIPEINDETGMVTLNGPDLSGLYSDQGATASSLKPFMNMPADTAIQTIVAKRFRPGQGGITVQIDPVAGTVGGLFGQDAVQTRTPVRTMWDLILSIADGQGMVAYFQGTTLVVQHVPDTTAAPLVLSHRTPGTHSVLTKPRWMAQPHSKRDYLVQVYSYNTRAGRVDEALGGNHDAAEAISIYASPNYSPGDLQKRADSTAARYAAMEYQAHMQFVEPVSLRPAQPIVIESGASYSIYKRVTGRSHPYYVLTQTTSYDVSKDGITVDVTCTNRIPAIQDKNTAGSVSI